MIELDDALAAIGAAVGPLGDERIALSAAVGRVLRERIVADRDFPPTDRSAMDGYAVRADDLRTGEAVLELAGELRAGQAADDVRVEAGRVVRIMTGAVVPRGADAVVMVERTEESADGRRVTLRDSPRPGSNIRRRGEDLETGATVLEAGRVIGAAEIAALASVGADPVQVAARPAVHVLATGDEVVDAATRPQPHQVRNSNSPALVALLARAGIAPRRVATVRDTAPALDAALEEALRGDLVLLTGGVSVGRYDLVADALGRAGVRTLFHGVAIKPGKPVFAGVGPGGCFVLALPGNPVSAFAGFVLFGAAALARMQGLEPWRPREPPARLTERLVARAGRRTYHPAWLTLAGDGLRATPIATRGSGDVLSLARANGFVVTPVEGGTYEVGATLAALSWDAPAASD